MGMGPISPVLGPDAKNIDFSVINSTQSATLSVQNKFIFCINSSDIVFTIEPDATVDFPAGSYMDFQKAGLGEITIARGSGVEFFGVFGDANFKLAGVNAGGLQNGSLVRLMKSFADQWYYFGAVKTTV